MFSDAQLATAIDCEGYIGINRMLHPSGRIQHSAKIGLAMNHPAIPAALKVRFGGSLRLEYNPKGRCELHRWEMCGNVQSGPTISALLPFLVVKREQALNVLAFLVEYHKYPRPHRMRPRPLEEIAVLDSFWKRGKDLNVWKRGNESNSVAPATTERENPETGCYSLNSQETVREDSEEKPPIH